MRNKGLLLLFLLATYTNLSAYEAYAHFVYPYNFGFAMVIWGILQIFSLRTLYVPFERHVLKIFKIELAREEQEMPIRAAFEKHGKWLVVQGLLQAFSFFLMLPFLDSVANALFFVVIYSLSGLIKVAFAIRLFKDPVQNPIWYFTGLTVAATGAIFFKIGTIFSQRLFLDGDFWVLFVVVCLKLTCEVSNSLVVRKISDKNIAHDKVIPVKIASEVSSVFELIIALPVGIFLFLTQKDQDIVPTMTNLLGLLWIGLVISLFSSLAGRLTNILKHGATVPLQATRPLFGFIISTLISQDYTNFSHQLLSIGLVCMGAFIAMGLGKPFPKKSNLSVS